MPQTHPKTTMTTYLLISIFLVNLSKPMHSSHWRRSTNHPQAPKALLDALDQQTNEEKHFYHMTSARHNQPVKSTINTHRSKIAEFKRMEHSIILNSMATHMYKHSWSNFMDQKKRRAQKRIQQEKAIKEATAKLKQMRNFRKNFKKRLEKERKIVKMFEKISRQILLAKKLKALQRAKVAVGRRQRAKYRGRGFRGNLDVGDEEGDED